MAEVKRFTKAVAPWLAAGALAVTGANALASIDDTAKPATVVSGADLPGVMKSPEVGPENNTVSTAKSEQPVNADVGAAVAQIEGGKMTAVYTPEQLAQVESGELGGPATTTPGEVGLIAPETTVQTDSK